MRSEGAGRRGLSLRIPSPSPATEQQPQGARQRGTYRMKLCARSVSGGVLRGCGCLRIAALPKALPSLDGGVVLKSALGMVDFFLGKKLLVSQLKKLKGWVLVLSQCCRDLPLPPVAGLPAALGARVHGWGGRSAKGPGPRLWCPGRV